MKQFLTMLFIGCALLSSNPSQAQQNSTSRNKVHADAPPAMKVLTQLFGDWDAFSVSRNRDGTWSNDTIQAEWRWYSILDGHAIQDDWLKFVETDGSAPELVIVGTNIRIYNAKENRWDMAWIDSNNHKLLTFTAENGDNTVTMSGQNAAGRETRNTFFDISANEFHWKQEWTFDDGASWLVVSKMHCVRQR